MATIDDLKQEYESLFEREKKIDEDLQLLLANQNLNDAKFNSLKSIIMKIQMVHKDSQNLSNMINFTSNLADNVSNKVRQLDLAKGRVTSCIKRVTDILDLKACTDGVTEALKEEDYESAANHIHKYLSLDKESLRLKTNELSSSMTSDELKNPMDVSESVYLDHSFKLLQDSKMKLQSIVTERYDQALNSNDIPELERFFKIFPLIGLRDLGIERFSAYLCSQIHASAEKSFQSLVEQTIIGASDPAAVANNRWSILFADALILLFERVARLVEAYQPVIEASYGFGNMFGFVKNIQSECDKQAVRILSKFRETRKLAFILRSVNNSNLVASYSRNSASVPTTEDRIDPRDLDELLTEITLISSRTELYKSFLLKSIVADLPPVPSSENLASPVPLSPSSSDSTSANTNANHPQKQENEKQLNDFRKFLNSTSLQCNIQELIGQYSVLENYFMTENINKAIQMDAINRNSLTSSVVDDTFFIIKKCIKRCLCSDSVDGCCAMFNNCSTALESIYKDFFFSKLKAGFPAGFDLTQAYTAIKSRFQTTDQIERQKVNFLITLNNIEDSIECLSTIKKLFEEDISKLFVHESQSSKEKLTSCLNDLSSVGARFKELLDFGFNQLVQNELKPRVKQLCEVYQTINHRINEDELNQYESNDPFIQNFVKNIDQMLSSLKESLSSKNQDILTGLVASEVATQFEKNILKCNFSKYGGLHLDKEIRVLVNYLTSLTSWSIREKFARLSQITILLSLETLSELFEYWNSPLAITWRLTPNEIRHILRLRSDFRPEEVMSLKL